MTKTQHEALAALANPTTPVEGWLDAWSIALRLGRKPSAAGAVARTLNSLVAKGMAESRVTAFGTGITRYRITSKGRRIARIQAAL